MDLKTALGYALAPVVVVLIRYALVPVYRRIDAMEDGKLKRFLSLKW